MAASRLDEKDLFTAARRIVGADARRQFLLGACGDDGTLIARLEALLRIHDEDDVFLESPAEGVVPPRLLLGEEAVGTVIGPYQLVQQIGEGGMGTVFRAEQTHPVRRTVALKIIRPGMDTRPVLARLEAERQALALMNHSNIAKFLDAGTTAAGRPYFVMELVDGLPITAHCDQSRLTVRQRLDLFVAVCRGVQHAHQKGVIHRDLKPSNVLVSRGDGEPVPKIIDFGLAKATGRSLTDSTLVTQFGLVIGTPAYMSPEQAEPTCADADTRTDVYSLGVLLYELLTGTTPLRWDRDADRGLAEFLRVVREEDPPRPSVRLAGEAGLPATASARGVDPKSLVGELRGDLDWIAMRCLEKDRARRYQTVEELARDIERHLRDEPVEASPPGAGYRARKFARRHRTALAGAAVIVGLVVAGVAVSTLFALNAMSERDAKNAALGAEAEQLRAALAERQRADDEAADARAVAEFLRDDLLGQADVGNQAANAGRKRDLTVREALDRAAAGIGEKYKGRRRTEGRIRHAIGDAYSALGEYPSAQAQFEQAREILSRELGPTHHDTLTVANNLGLLLRARGKYPEAAALFEEVRAGRRATLGDDHDATLTAMHNLGTVYRDLARYDDAEKLFTTVAAARRAAHGLNNRSTLLALNNVGIMHLTRGRFTDAEPVLKDVVKGLNEVEGPDHPFTLICTNNLAGCYMELHRPDDAEPLYRKVFEIQSARLPPGHPDTLLSANFLGLLLHERKKYDEAERLLRTVLDERRKKLDPDHPDTLTSVSNLAITLDATGRGEEAERLFKQALDGRRAKLRPDDPDNFRSANNLGACVRDRGRPADAEPLFREAADGARKKLGLKHRQTRLYLNNLIDVLLRLGRPADAEAFSRELAGFLRGVGAHESLESGDQQVRLARCLLGQKKYAEAAAAAREGLKLIAAHDADGWRVLEARSVLGGSLCGLEKYDEAEPLLKQAYAGLKEFAGGLPRDARGALVESRERLARFHEARGNSTEAKRLRAGVADPAK